MGGENEMVPKSLEFCVNCCHHLQNKHEREKRKYLEDLAAFQHPMKTHIKRVCVIQREIKTCIGDEKFNRIQFCHNES